MKKRVEAICESCAKHNGGEWDATRYRSVSLNYGLCTICEQVTHVVSPGYWRNISGNDASRYEAAPSAQERKADMATIAKKIIKAELARLKKADADTKAETSNADI